MKYSPATYFPQNQRLHILRGICSTEQYRTVLWCIGRRGCAAMQPRRVTERVRQKSDSRSQSTKGEGKDIELALLLAPMPHPYSPSFQRTLRRPHQKKKKPAQSLSFCMVVSLRSPRLFQFPERKGNNFYSRSPCFPITRPMLEKKRESFFRLPWEVHGWGNL